MILQSLVECCETLITKGKIGREGWCEAKVSYAININTEGEFCGLQSLQNAEIRGKKEVMVSCSMTVPQHPTRSGKMPPPYFLCDNAKYLLGAWIVTGDIDKDSASEKKANDYFLAAAEYHKLILKNAHCTEASSIINFFEKWNFNENYEKLTVDIVDLMSAEYFAPAEPPIHFIAPPVRGMDPL